MLLWLNSFGECSKVILENRQVIDLRVRPGD